MFKSLVQNVQIFGANLMLFLCMNNNMYLKLQKFNIFKKKYALGIQGHIFHYYLITASTADNYELLIIN